MGKAYTGGVAPANRTIMAVIYIIAGLVLAAMGVLFSGARIVLLAGGAGVIVFSVAYYFFGQKWAAWGLVAVGAALAGYLFVAMWTGAPGFSRRRMITSAVVLVAVFFIIYDRKRRARAAAAGRRRANIDSNVAALAQLSDESDPADKPTSPSASNPPK